MKSLKSLAILAIAALSFAACQKEENDKLNTAEYDAVIAEAEALASSATTDEYPAEAIATFKTAISNAKTAMEAVTSQSHVDNIVANVKAAIETFKNSAYGAIPSEALTFECKFDGETDKTTGSNAWTLTACAGPKEVFSNETLPTYVDGKVGKAVKLENGANFNITGFNPSALAGSAISVAVWVKPSKVYANNYIISFNRWSSWKLQLQDGSKPFFTLAHSGGITDMDNETDNSCPANEWHHVVVSADLSAGTVDFYVDGQLTKAWTEKCNGTITTLDENYLCIGQQCSWEVACGDDWFNPADANADNWSCFWGLLDELKVYNVALTAGQVSKLYNSEK